VRDEDLLDLAEQAVVMPVTVIVTVVMVVVVPVVMVVRVVVTVVRTGVRVVVRMIVTVVMVLVRVRVPAVLVLGRAQGVVSLRFTGCRLADRGCVRLRICVYA
jgi:hypothetical protein